MPIKVIISSANLAASGRKDFADIKCARGFSISLIASWSLSLEFTTLVSSIIFKISLEPGFLPSKYITFFL